MPRRRIRRRPAKTKSISERIHAKRRAFERYGLSLVKRDIQEICRQIEARKDASLISRQSLRVSHWEVLFRNTTLHVVYDKRRDMVITFLPPDVLEAP